MHKGIGMAIVAGAVATAGCSEARSESGGPAVQRNYQVGSFERIEVAGPYAVEVRTGANPSVQAIGPEKQIERMVVEVKGDKLSIHSKTKNSMFNFGWKSDGEVRLVVTVPQLRAAEIAGSGGIRVNRVKGDQFNGQIAGSGDLSIEQLEVQSLGLTIAGSGSARAERGRANTVSYEIAGSGDIDGRGIAAETASVSIAGSGSVSAHATRSANVDVAGSGNVEVGGGGKCSVSKQGSGNVRCS
jgi:hypothetical protein